MSELLLLSNEQIISQSTDGSIVLTNQRLASLRSSWGKQDVTTLLLRHVNSFEIHYQHRPLILIIGIVFCLVSLIGIYSKGLGSEEAAVLLIGGLVLVIFYLLTRRHVVSVRTDGGAIIEFATKGMNGHDVIAFINKVQKAKLESH
jgi:hypothetical protein